MRDEGKRGEGLPADFRRSSQMGRGEEPQMNTNGESGRGCFNRRGVEVGAKGEGLCHRVTALTPEFSASRKLRGFRCGGSMGGRDEGKG